MIKLEYDLDIYCKRCRKSINIKTINSDFASTEMERSLSYETTHECIKNIKCHNCNNDIQFIIEVFEYPTSVINFSQIFGNGYFKDSIIEKIEKINKENEN